MVIVILNPEGVKNLGYPEKEDVAPGSSPGETAGSSALITLLCCACEGAHRVGQGKGLRWSGWADLRSPRRGKRRPLPSTGSEDEILEILITLLCCAWKARTSGTSVLCSCKGLRSRGGRTCAVLAGETDGLFLNKTVGVGGLAQSSQGKPTASPFDGLWERDSLNIDYPSVLCLEGTHIGYLRPMLWHWASMVGRADLRSPRRGNRRPLPSTGSGNGIVDRSGWADLNRRPLRPKRSALANCATPRRVEYNRCMPNPSRNGHFIYAGCEACIK